MNKIIVIGSGFSSLSASCYLARAGYSVEIFEKNTTVGGRARQLVKDGFTFDIGPSWYWMPDIFEKFFADFGKRPSDYYDLEKLDPAYKIFFHDDVITIGDCMDKICDEFERIESGSSKHLKSFIGKAQENYDIAINKVVLRPGLSPLELVTKETVIAGGPILQNHKSRSSQKVQKSKADIHFGIPSAVFGCQTQQYTFVLQFHEFC